MAAILQYSVRANPGPLDVGGFTLANFTAMLKPLYAARVRRYGMAVPADDRRHQPSCSGYPLAYALVRSTNATVKSFILICDRHAPLSGEVVRTYSWIVVLGSNGFVNRFLVKLGIIAQPLHALYRNRRYHCARALSRCRSSSSRRLQPSLAIDPDRREGAEQPWRRPVTDFLHRDIAALRPRYASPA